MIPSASAPSRTLLLLLACLGLLLSALTRAGEDTDVLAKARAESRLGAEVLEGFAKSDRPQRLFLLLDDAAGNSKVQRHARAEALAKDSGARLLRQFDSLDAVVLEGDLKALQRLLDSPAVLRIDSDPAGVGGLPQARPLAGIDPLFASGLDGLGTHIAVLDSGHDPLHPAFAGRISAELCFCSGNGCCPNGQASQTGSGAASDDNGHGSNVSGIALGSGQAAPRGVAPAAELVSIKVLDRNNAFCCASDVVAGLDAVLSSHPEVDVVNLSLGTNATFANECDGAAAWTQAMAQAVRGLRARGTAVVAASLNGGNRSALPAPACISGVLAVGAVWDADLGQRTFTQNDFSCTETAVRDRLTCFSNTSSQLDLVAPGAVLSAAGRGGGSSSYSGTSQASPMVAGCAALLRQAAPQATLAQIEAALLASTVQVDDAQSGRRYPRLDCSHALAQLAGGNSVNPDHIGSQFWLSGAGQVEGPASAPLLRAELQSANGGRFGADHVASAVQVRRWGELEIRFSGCDAAELRWRSQGPDSAGFGEGGFALQRIAPTRASEACGQRGLAAMESRDWMAGTWYGGPARSGEGVFLDVLANGVVLVAFFGHRPQGF